MATSGLRRIFVALRPTVLEGAFAALLGDGQRSNVVQCHGASADEMTDHYDVAIVTDGFTHDVDSDVLITLPDTEAGGDAAIISVGGLRRLIRTRSHEDVIDLLAEQFSTELGPISAARARARETADRSDA